RGGVGRPLPRRAGAGPRLRRRQRLRYGHERGDERRRRLHRGPGHGRGPRLPPRGTRRDARPGRPGHRGAVPPAAGGAGGMKLVLASNNAGKLAEFSRLLEGSGLQVVPQAELGVDDVEETGLTFVENALLKARNASRATGLPALADDSGLCVDALNGAPGLYSARYAGPGGDAGRNIAKLLDALEDVPDERRSARFCCALVLLRHAEDPQPLIAEGRWEGRILHAPRGSNGFGYDPVFLDPENNLTAAELDPAIKNRISHRGQAMALLVKKLAAAGGAVQAR